MRSNNDSRPRASPWLKLAAAGSLLFIHVPLLFIVLYAFTTEDRSYQFPPPGLTLKWFAVAWERQDVFDALGLSVEIASVATLAALVLGTLAGGALARSRFFGREAISLLFVLPIALPGIITGISLRAAFDVASIPFSFWTIVLGHATFCIVVVYNNVLARLRRMGTTLEEASADLGADGFQTFALVTFPQLRSALLAGGLLAFALSFDEIVVTQFTISAGLQTLPVWIFGNLFRPNQAPVVNVVAAVLVLASVLPIWAAQKLSGDTAGGRL